MTTTLRTEPAKRQAPPEAVQHRRWWRGIGSFIALTVLGAAVLEVAFNAAGVGLEEILQPDLQFGTRHIASKHVVWRMEGYSDDWFNSDGLRDIEHSVAKPAGTYRIALLGDSSTEGLQVPMDQTYGRVLEKLLTPPPGFSRTEVINFATSGYSTGQEVMQFEQQVAHYKPDLTLLLYNRGDALENVRKPYDLRCEPRPYFYLDRNGVLHQDNAVLAAHAADLQPNATVEFLRRNSRIFGVFNHANLNLSINEALYRKLRGWVLLPFQTASKRKAVTPLTVPYDIQDGVAVTTALLERLRSDCTNAGSNFVLVTFPNVVLDKEFGAQIDKFNAMSQTDGFGFFDLTPVFNYNPQPMSLFLKYHFSSKGHKLVAEQLAQYLQRPGS